MKGGGTMMEGWVEEADRSVGRTFLTLSSPI